jgi:hypothetical protein
MSDSPPKHLVQKSQFEYNIKLAVVVHQYRLVKNYQNSCLPHKYRQKEQEFCAAKYYLLTVLLQKSKKLFAKNISKIS